MTTLSYSLRIDDPIGNTLFPTKLVSSITSASVEYTVTSGGSGVLLAELPRKDVDESLLMKDGRISVWRSVGSRAPMLDSGSVYLIRKWKYTRFSTKVWAYHANSIFRRRIVAYKDKTSYTVKSAAPADDQMRTIWLENFSTSINTTDRQGDDTGADISAYVATQNARSQGPNIDESIAWELCDGVMERTSDQASQQLGYVVAEIVCPNGKDLEFRTYYGARGTDRRAGTSSALIFSEESGTVENVILEVDASEEATVIVAKGGGDSDNAIVQVALDSARIAESPLGRIERLVEKPDITSDNALLDVARAELYNRRPKVTLSGELTQTSKIRGVDYDLGDLVSIRFRGKMYDCRFDQLMVYLSTSGSTERCILTGI